MRKSTRATKEFHKLQKQQVLKDTPKRTPPITNSKADESEENEGKGEGGTSSEGSSGYKVELLVLHDQKIRIVVQYVLFPAFLVYHVIVLFNRPPCTYVKGKLKYVSVIYVGS